MTTLKCKQNDSGRPILDILRDDNGTVGQGVGGLTGATVKFLARNAETLAVSVNAIASITDAAGAGVRYALTAADLAVAGTYQFEWEITFGDGSRFTVPSEGYHYLFVGDDIA